MKKLVPVLAIILLGAGAYVAVKNISNSDKSVAGDFKDVSIPSVDPSAFAPASETAPALSANTADYSDPSFKFKISYPSDLDLHIYKEDEGGRTVTFEGASPGEGFQVFIVPYIQNVITDARFKRDDPSGVMRQPQDITIDGAPAKMFFGHNDSMGDTREVWFIRGGYLYEVTTYKALDTWLAAIMQSWRFL
jgi:hypothetical protein